MSIKPKKSLGQHFLRDRQVAERIAGSLSAESSDCIIEIGPGTGALTRELVLRFSNIHAFEVDQRSVEVLQREFPDVTVYEKSVLDADFISIVQGFARAGDRSDSAEMHRTGSGEAKRNVLKGEPRGDSGDEAAGEMRPKLFITGNLPYYLTSPILFQVLDQGNLFSEAVFMIQKEVAERLVARPRTKEYGILSVQAQVLGSMELLFPVSPQVFYPPPKVDSAVIRYRPGNSLYPGSVRDLGVPLGKFKSVVRTAFQQRRKMLSNALKPLFASGFPEGFNAGRRAEELEPHEFVDLARWIER